MANRGQRFRLSIDTYGTDMQLRLVAGGLGIGLAPTDVSRASPWRSQPSVVEVSDFALALAVWLVFPRYPASPRRAVGLLA
ncbi:hypothetical protein I6G79_01665 [Burkholderia plantarii]|nr:hypothetical protein [Burkholderia plantarii]